MLNPQEGEGNGLILGGDQRTYCADLVGGVIQVKIHLRVCSRTWRAEARAHCFSIRFPYFSPKESFQAFFPPDPSCKILLLKCIVSQFIQSVQLLSLVQLFVTPWTAAGQASLSITNSWSLLKLMSIASVVPSNHLILCQSLLLLPSIFPSIRIFSNESVLRVRWPKYWSFSFGVSPSNEYSGLISFRMDWLDLLAAICLCTARVYLLPN